MKKLITIVISLLFSQCILATDVDKIDFLIPGGEGGGWDTTARQTGQALIDSGLINSATYRNLSGSGGGRALIDLIENENKHENTLMVQSTPLILRNITGVIKNDYRDVRPVALMIAEFQVLVVPASSPFKNTADFVAAIEKSALNNPILGGSSKGSLDHITAALILKSAGLDSLKMRYIPSDGGGDALKRLYEGEGSGDAISLVTGYGEIVDDFHAGKLRILGISSENRLPGIDAPTFKEQGYKVVFANWRGFFARPTISDKQFSAYEKMLNNLHKTAIWADIRAKYGWADFYKSGEDLMQFLTSQEADIKETLQTLGIIK